MKNGPKRSSEIMTNLFRERCKSVLFALFCFFLISCRSINTEVKTWNARDYRNNSNSQLMAAQHALQKISIHSDDIVLDLGSGDGKITSQIAAGLKEGSATGLDISKNMVAFAAKSFEAQKNLRFVEKDAADIDYKDEFTLILSFSAMQWVQEQERALLGVFNALKADGRFLMMIPAGYPEALSLSLKEMMVDQRWNGYFIAFKHGQVFHSADEYRSMLKSAGFKDIEVELIPAFDRFSSINDFSNFVRQWLPHLSVLPPSMHDQFMNELMSRYQSILPPDEDGSVWFRKYSLEALAKKRN